MSKIPRKEADTIKSLERERDNWLACVCKGGSRVTGGGGVSASASRGGAGRQWERRLGRASYLTLRVRAPRRPPVVCLITLLLSFFRKCNSVNFFNLRTKPLLDNVFRIEFFSTQRVLIVGVCCNSWKKLFDRKWRDCSTPRTATWFYLDYSPFSLVLVKMS